MESKIKCNLCCKEAKTLIKKKFLRVDCGKEIGICEGCDELVKKIAKAKCLAESLVYLRYKTYGLNHVISRCSIYDKIKAQNHSNDSGGHPEDNNGGVGGYSECDDDCGEETLTINAQIDIPVENVSQTGQRIPPTETARDSVIREDRQREVQEEREHLERLSRAYLERER